jgi:hypothetical protein
MSHFSRKEKDMLSRLRRALSPSMVVALLALFVALGGVGIAATGGNFILGTPNTATSPTELSASGSASTSALKVTNTNTVTGSTALELNVPTGKAPMKVNSKTKVANLNADLLDGLESTSWVRRGLALNVNVNPAQGNGAVDVTNTGSGNGVQGKTDDVGASGVYGEHNGPGGFGVAGRAGDAGHAIYGDNTGNGFAGYFEDKVHVGGNLDVGGSVGVAGTLNCTSCVEGADVTGKVSNSDTLDGIDSAQLMQAVQGGTTDGQAVATGPNTTVFVGPTIGGLIRLRYQCPNNLGGNGTLRIMNNSTGQANLFVDRGGANPDYWQLGAGGYVEYPAAAGGESFFIQMQGSPGVALVSAATVHRASLNDCHTQAFGTVAG